MEPSFVAGRIGRRNQPFKCAVSSPATLLAVHQNSRRFEAGQLQARESRRGREELRIPAARHSSDLILFSIPKRMLTADLIEFQSEAPVKTEAAVK
jgi:hypothetical protein